MHVTAAIKSFDTDAPLTLEFPFPAATDAAEVELPILYDFSLLVILPLMLTFYYLFIPSCSRLDEQILSSSPTYNSVTNGMDKYGIIILQMC